MKENKVPENIYIPEKIYLPYKDGKVIGLVKETGVPYKSGVDGNIEYTRTDVFIKKAVDYIKKDMLDNLAFQGRLNRIEIIDGIIEKFIKSMKGE